jgi:hypothetical protein
MKVQVSTCIVDAGHVPTSNFAALTTEAQINQELAGHNMAEDVAEMTEVQRRAVHHYVRAIALGTNTSSVETAISAII